MSEAPVQETASLHEKAVQAIAKGEVPKMARKPRKKGKKRNGDLLHIVPDPQMWAAAQEIVNDPANSYTVATSQKNPEAITGIEVIVR